MCPSECALCARVDLSRRGIFTAVLGFTRKPRIFSYYYISKFMSANGIPLMRYPCAVHSLGTYT